MPVKNSDIIEGLPNICGMEKEISEMARKNKDLYARISNIDFERVQSSCGIALHMHQPTIPASTGDLRNAWLISNLQYMMEHQDIGDNHNASVFYWCYYRISDFVRDMVEVGQNPRVMLDYSGNLLWGLRQMNNGEALDKLRQVTSDK